MLSGSWKELEMLLYGQQVSYQPKKPAWCPAGRWCGITALRIASGVMWLTPFESDPLGALSVSHRLFRRILQPWQHQANSTLSEKNKQNPQPHKFVNDRTVNRKVTSDSVLIMFPVGRASSPETTR